MYMRIALVKLWSHTTSKKTEQPSLEAITLKELCPYSSSGQSFQKFEHDHN